MKEPLVSIVIITYNSSKYLLETLESAKAQTYNNIELIISDDGSTDDTIEICRNWLENNQQRFKYSKIITVKKNTGIPANCNRGVKASKGEWIKIIAGDDVLMTDCININIERTLISNSKMFYSKVLIIKGGSVIDKKTVFYNEILKKFSNKRNKKRSFLRLPVMLNTPTFFIETKLLQDLEGFDESYKILEDQSFLSKFFINDYELEYIDQTTVRYRFHDDNVSSDNKLFNKDLFRCYIEMQRPYLKLSFNLKDIIFLIYRDVYFKLLFKANISLVERQFFKLNKFMHKIY